MNTISTHSEESELPYSISRKEWNVSRSGYPSNSQLLASISFLVLRYTGNQLPTVAFIENGERRTRSWNITESTQMGDLLEDFTDAANTNSNESGEISPWNPIYVTSDLEPESLVKEYLENVEEQERPDLFFVTTPDSKNALSILSFHQDHDQQFLDQMLTHWMHAVQLLEEKPEATVTTLPILLDEELQTLTQEWNDTAVPSEDGKFDFEEFDIRADQIPENTAIRSGGKLVKYRELKQKTNQLARYLQSLGVKPEVVVGIYLPRSVDFVVSLVGLTKSGGAFLPIDPEQASDRKAYMIKDSQVPFIICSRDNHESLPEGEYKKLIIEDLWDEISQFPTTTPDHGLKFGNMSYLFYTSGSTGKPKGVCMTHTYQDRRNKKTRAFPIKSEKVLLKSSTGFTVILLETFSPLKAGGEIVIVPQGMDKDAGWMIDAIQREQVETLNLVPSMLSLLIYEGIENCTSIKKVYTVGERLPVSLQREFFKKLPEAKLFVFYGCTEAPAATFREVLPDENYGDRVVLGKPNFNKRIYLLDEFKVPAPLGIPGELFVGGKISRGYSNNQALTNERFIQDPFVDVEEARMYQTGDMGRFLPDGNIEFLGRTDFQVQVRGIRVEPAEIDLSLAGHQGVGESVTIAREDASGDYRFITYFVPSNTEAPPASKDLSDYLKTKLPYYLVPAKFVQMDRIPLLLNGKIDRKSLPIEEIVGTRESDENSSPRNKQEADLVALWELVIDVKQIGIHDNFFDLGGNSMNILRVSHRIKQSTGKTISIADIIAHPTIAELSQLLDSTEESTNYIHKFGGEGDKTPIFFFPVINRNSLIFGDLAHSLSEDRPCYGIELPQPENEIEPLQSFEELASHCIKEIKKIQPEGPYNLAGYSFGGSLACETAYQLDSVANLILFDSLPSGPISPITSGRIEWAFKWLLKEKHHYLGYTFREMFNKIGRSLGLKKEKDFLLANKSIIGDVTLLRPGMFHNGYCSRPVNTKLLIFTARDTEYSYNSGTRMEAWKDFSEFPIDFCRVKAHSHIDLLKNTNTGQLSARIKAQLASS